MAMLENLSVEVLHEVVSSLAFFDKKALSTTSKLLHSKIGPLKCPNISSWMIHLCRSLPICADHWLILHSDIVFECLQDLTRSIQSCHLIGVWRPDEPAHRSIDEFLFMNYFNGSYPESTLAYFYYRCINEFATSAISVAKGVNPSIVSPDYVSGRWSLIERESRLDLEWLGWSRSFSRDRTYPRAMLGCVAWLEFSGRWQRIRDDRIQYAKEHGLESADLTLKLSNQLEISLDR